MLTQDISRANESIWWRSSTCQCLCHLLILLCSAHLDEYSIYAGLMYNSMVRILYIRFMLHHWPLLSPQERPTCLSVSTNRSWTRISISNILFLCIEATHFKVSNLLTSPLIVASSLVPVPFFASSFSFLTTSP